MFINEIIQNYMNKYYLLHLTPQYYRIKFSSVIFFFYGSFYYIFYFM